MNQKGFIKDIVIVILGVVILVGGYFFFFKKPANAPADWKTYRNNEYGFELKYPEYFPDMKGDILKGIETRSSKTDNLEFKIYERPLDGFEYINHEGAFIFKYDAKQDKWIPDQIGVEDKFAPIKYNKNKGLNIYVVRTQYEKAYIESPKSNFILEITALRDGSWIDCINPCPDEKPFSDGKTIESILDSIKFTK